MNYFGFSKQLLVGSPVSQATRTTNSPPANNKRLFATTVLNGYRAGGVGSAQAADIDKFNLSAETISLSTATLGLARNRHTGYGNTGWATYYYGGYNGTYTGREGDKYMYASDTALVIDRCPFSSIGLCVMNNAKIAGYMLNSDPQQWKLVYASESFSALSVSSTFLTNSGNMSFTNFTTAGYMYSNLVAKTTNKIAFATETQSVLAGTQVSRVYNGTGTSNVGTAGYQHTGNDGSTSAPFAKQEKLVYSSETYSAIADAPNTGSGGAGIEKIGTAGYVLGGTTPVYTSGGTQILKTNYSTDATTTLGATITTGTRDNYCSGTTNYGVL